MSIEALILGAGPAGCASAIALGRAGHSALLIDRHAEPPDSLCGGFLSWRTQAQLEAMGVDLGATGAHRVDRLALHAGGAQAIAMLPQPGWGLSRRALDAALRCAAIEAGARVACDSIRTMAPADGQGLVRLFGHKADYEAPTLFLASGKHDLRGHSRPRRAADSALGLRLRLPPSPARHEMLGQTIELHLFATGYAGIVLQEDGAANVCLAIRKSALAAAGGDPAMLLARLAAANPALAARLGEDWPCAPRQIIGAVPYGWIAQETTPGVFRLGDQAAVIPSLAGEGIGMALASGTMAAGHWQVAGPQASRRFQRTFARAAARPVLIARACRALAESPKGARMAIWATQWAPGLAARLAEATRVAAPEPGPGRGGAS